MTITQNIAKHFREVHFGKNWTWSDLQAQLKDVDWQQALTKLEGFNTIATLVYHIHYFVVVITKVMEGGPLEGSDKLSFAHPPIGSQANWEAFLAEIWAAAERLAQLIEQMPEERLFQTFGEEKYGTYYRNLHGVTEHAHYHLGQIALLKKLIAAQAAR
jgi:hypothetical protein